MKPCWRKTPAVSLPYRKEWWPKGEKYGTGGLMILRQSEPHIQGHKIKFRDEWDVFKRKYSKNKGGYSVKIKGGVSQQTAESFVKNYMSTHGCNG